MYKIKKIRKLFFLHFFFLALRHPSFIDSTGRKGGKKKKERRKLIIFGFHLMNNCNYGFFTFWIKKLEFRVRIINHVYKIEVGIKMGIMENERLVPRGWELFSHSLDKLFCPH
ncbi:hypothetical protein WN943_000804 [Citrus x changshan-huyou]